jgi:hypothetical protein
VLIPWEFWQQCKHPDDGSAEYQKGFIVLLEPSWYFNATDADEVLAPEGVILGKNALLDFRRRSDWEEFKPGSSLPNGMPFQPATSRTEPLEGVYIARIHATTSEDGEVIRHGFNTSGARGAGIRVYEYASTVINRQAKLQLEALFWMCHDAHQSMIDAGISAADVETRQEAIHGQSSAAGLLDFGRLRSLRVLNAQDQLTCPLCLKPISGKDFLKRLEQAEGRAVYDVTITEVTLFHIQELSVGKLQHKPYNLGWGHQFCNLVVRDCGIVPTLAWMLSVLNNQSQASTSLGESLDSVEEAVDR